MTVQHDAIPPPVHASIRVDSPPERWPRWRGLWELTRPGFLWLSISAALLGLAGHTGWRTEDIWRAALILFLIAAAHAAINAWNDVHDALSGADASNLDRFAPFCGGSRALQEGGLDEVDARRLVLGLGVVSAGGGLWLALHAEPALLWIGALGLLLGWAYSAPPLALMRRGLGEVTVAVCWGLIPVGARLALGDGVAGLGWLMPLAPAFGACAILVVANIADADADRANGKRTLVVQLGPRHSRMLFIALQSALWLLLVGAVWLDEWPRWTLLALLALPFSLLAIRRAHAARTSREPMRHAIPAAIQTSLVFNLALALGFALA